MGDVAQLNLEEQGREARLRALLEDMVEYHKGVYPHGPLALAVWFAKSPREIEHCLLELFSGIPVDRIAGPTRISLNWKAGSKESPFVLIDATSVAHFTQQLEIDRQALAKYFDRPEVLYFDKELLTGQIIQAFTILTEPAGLIKGWYISSEEFKRLGTLPALLAAYGQSRPYIGLVKTGEAKDFEFCRGFLNAEIGQRWLPISQGGLTNYSFFIDIRSDRPGYFLFEGGSLYQILKFEIKTAPEYATRVLERSRDDRYVEVYLRAVPAREQPAA